MLWGGLGPAGRWGLGPCRLRRLRCCAVLVRETDKEEGSARQGVLDVVPGVGVVSAVRRVQSTCGHPGRAGVTGMNDNYALPVMLVAGLDEENLRAILLVVQVVRDADLGIAAFLGSEVEREARALVVDRHARVAAVAPNVWVLALRRWDGLMRDIIDIWRVGRAAESPGGVGGDLILGLGEEENAVGCEMRGKG